MKLALLNDIHLGGARTESEVIADHQERFYRDVFFPYLNAHGIDHIVILGDVFERRRFINYHALQRAYTSFFDPALANDIHIDILAGNHDVYYRNTNELSSLNLLLARYPNINLFIDEPDEQYYDGMWIGLVPWMCEANQDKITSFLRNTRCSAIFGHFEFAGFEMNQNFTTDKGDDPATLNLQRFDFVLTGHYHHKSTKGNITYLGCQYDMDWHDYGSRKFFHVLDTKTKELTAVENPNRVFIKLYYKDALLNGLYNEVETVDIKSKFVKLVVLSKNDAYHFEQTINKLKDQHPEQFVIIEQELTNADQEQTEGAETKELDVVIVKHVEATNMEPQLKSDVIALLTEIYTEASATSE